MSASIIAFTLRPRALRRPCSMSFGSSCARLAAGRRAQLDPKLIEQGRRSARGRNVKAMIEADIAFHNAIYAASGNPLIGASAQLHWVHLRRVMGAVLQLQHQRATIWDEHAAIAACS